MTERAIWIVAVSQLEANLGREVSIEGKVANAKLGAVVLLEATPVYLDDTKAWPANVVGRKVSVRGILQRFEVPIARQDEHGNWSGGVSADSIYKLTRPNWTVLN